MGKPDEPGAEGDTHWDGSTWWRFINGAWVNESAQPFAPDRYIPPEERV